MLQCLQTVFGNFGNFRPVSFFDTGKLQMLPQVGFKICRTIRCLPVFVAQFLPLLFFYEICIGVRGASDDAHQWANGNYRCHFPLLSFAAAKKIILLALKTYHLKPSYVLNDIRTSLLLPYSKINDAIAVCFHVGQKCVSVRCWPTHLFRP